MADYLVTDTELTSIANAIRTKGGTLASLTFPTGYVSAINDISTGIVPTGTKNISISSSGTTTEDVTNYASVSITVPAYTGSHHSVTPAYTVQIALTNPINASYFSSCQVHEWLSSDITDVGNVIGSIESAAGSTAVTVDGIYGISIVIDGMSVYIPESGISCTGNVTYSGGDGMGALMFQVTGDGAITINGVDYDD